MDQVNYNAFTERNSMQLFKTNKSPYLYVYKKISKIYYQAKKKIKVQNNM